MSERDERTTTTMTETTKEANEELSTIIDLLTAHGIEPAPQDCSNRALAMVELLRQQYDEATKLNEDCAVMIGEKELENMRLRRSEKEWEALYGEIEEKLVAQQMTQRDVEGLKNIIEHGRAANAEQRRQLDDLARLKQQVESDLKAANDSNKQLYQRQRDARDEANELSRKVNDLTDVINRMMDDDEVIVAAWTEQLRNALNPERQNGAESTIDELIQKSSIGGKPEAYSSAESDLVSTVQHFNDPVARGANATTYKIYADLAIIEAAKQLVAARDSAAYDSTWRMREAEGRLITAVRRAYG